MFLSRSHVLSAALLLTMLAGLAAPLPAAAEPGRENGVREAIERLVTRAEAEPVCRAIDWPAVQRFYRNRAYLPAWWEPRHQQRSRARDTVLALLADSPQHGLAITDYHYYELVELSTRRTPAELARFDVLLTDAFLAYARHLYSGRSSPERIDPNWHIEPATMDGVELLERVLATGDFAGALNALAPPHRGYQRLEKLLSQYRGLAATGGWPEVETGPLLARGDRDLRVPTLRKRLWLEGYVSRWSEDDYVFDAALEAAVERFQANHGIEPDGVVGPATRQVLNVPVVERIHQIMLNMERWRWLPRDLGERYIMVNMAGFRLQWVEGGERALDMRVIIGKPYRSTPAFVDHLTYLVFNPYWKIPDRIMREDLLPQQKADPGYLASRNIRILTSWGPDAEEIDPENIDWKEVDPARFPYRLRQDPGPENSLGRVKFMLPNRFNIYLHDTPSRHLFERTVRTFSSGCIRLQEPLALAEAVLQTAQGEWDATAIRELIATGETHRVRLGDAIPVYLLYWTAWVDDRGMANFRRDVYGLDQRMAEWRQDDTN